MQRTEQQWTEVGRNGKPRKSSSSDSASNSSSSSSTGSYSTGSSSTGRARTLAMFIMPSKANGKQKNGGNKSQDPMARAYYTHLNDVDPQNKNDVEMFGIYAQYTPNLAEKLFPSK